MLLGIGHVHRLRSCWCKIPNVDIVCRASGQIDGVYVWSPYVDRIHAKVLPLCEGQQMKPTNLHFFRHDKGHEIRKGTRNITKPKIQVPSRILVSGGAIAERNSALCLISSDSLSPSAPASRNIPADTCAQRGGMHAVTH